MTGPAGLSACLERTETTTRPGGQIVYTLTGRQQMPRLTSLPGAGTGLRHDLDDWTARHAITGMRHSRSRNHNRPTARPATRDGARTSTSGKCRSAAAEHRCRGRSGWRGLQPAAARTGSLLRAGKPGHGAVHDSRHCNTGLRCGTRLEIDQAERLSCDNDQVPDG